MIGDIFEYTLRAYRRWLGRLSRVEFWNADDLFQWVTTLDHFRSVTAFVFVPVLVGGVTIISNTVDSLSFLLFPPLAAVAYNMFAHPGSPSSSPLDVVGGLVIGGGSGWAAIAITAWMDIHAAGQFQVGAAAVVLSLFFTGSLLRLFDVDVAPAFAVGLLILVVDVPPGVYVLNVTAGTALIAASAFAWHRVVYDRRAQQLYDVDLSGTNVLVPLRTTEDGPPLLGARIAAGHEASKVILLENIAEEEGIDGEDIERIAAQIRNDVGVTCEIVRPGAPEQKAAKTTFTSARDHNCGLIVAPYEATGDSLSGYLRRLVRGNLDVIVAKTSRSTPNWERILVTVRRPGKIAHAMIEFARQLASRNGRISICTCINRQSERRKAETMCSSLAEAFDGPFETRVARNSVEEFLTEHAPRCDLIFIGASTDRSTASRLVSEPLFQRIQHVESDIAIVHRAQ